MNESLPPNVEAAVRLENRLTLMEAGWRGTHTSVDNLIALIGELRGSMEARFKTLEERDERRSAALEGLSDRHNSLIQEIRDRKGWERIEALEDWQKERERALPNTSMAEVSQRVSGLQKTVDRLTGTSHDAEVRSGVWRQQYTWLVGGIAAGGVMAGLIERLISLGVF